MGLDMYLKARRHITDEPTRQAIVNATADMKQWDDVGYHYLSRWPHSAEDERARTDKVITLVGLTPMIGEESNSAGAAFDGSWVDLTAVYWRKTNAVHAWFVDNCQEGVDECQQTVVRPEQLAALSAACTSALAAFVSGDLEQAQHCMAPRPGFFFGNYDLDEYWAEDLAYTVREIERVAHAAIVIGGVEFIYQSSW